LVVQVVQDQEHQMVDLMVVQVLEDTIQTVLMVKMVLDQQVAAAAVAVVIYQTYNHIIQEHIMEHPDHPQVLAKQDQKADLEL
jgi:predicted AAA+ superfamily ATPase